MERDLQQLVHLRGPWTTGQGPRYRLLVSAFHALIVRRDLVPVMLTHFGEDPEHGMTDGLRIARSLE